MDATDKNTKSTIITIIAVIAVCVLVGGITYAVFNWRSNNTNISATTKCFDIIGNSSYTVNGSEMFLFDESDILDRANHTITYKNGMIYYPFNIARINGCDSAVSYEIRVNVTELSSEYLNGAIKYKIIEDMSSYTSEEIQNPLNEELVYDDSFYGSIFETGMNVICFKTIDAAGNITPAVIFYIDGDLVPEDATDLVFTATVNIVAVAGNSNYRVASNYIKNLYTSAAKTTATVNNITYNLAPDVGLMNDRHASMSTGINDGDLHYYGAAPANYVWLGDTYTSDYSSSTGETIIRYAGDKKLWRIIGMFGDKLKLISNDFISSPDLSHTSNYDGTDNWEDSLVMHLVNPGYENMSINNSLYWHKGSGTVAYGYTSNNVSYVSTTTINFGQTGLTDFEKSLIDDASWSLISDSTKRFQGYVDEYYNDVYLNFDRKWNGKVGLMYASDYGYAADLSLCSVVLSSYKDCSSDNWLSGHGASSIIEKLGYGIFAGGADIGSFYGGVSTTKRHIHTVVYLKHNVVITDGTGTESDPFVLGVLQ